METQRFRIYNQTRRRFLKTELILVDASEDHVEARIATLAFQTGAGLWLKPYRELHATRVLPLFDMVYLDEQCRVIQEVELYPGLFTEPLTTQPASALLLPMGSILAFHLQARDQLDIRTTEPIKNTTEDLPTETVPELVALEEAPPAEEPPEIAVTPEDLPTQTIPEAVALEEASPDEEQPGVASATEDLPTQTIPELVALEAASPADAVAPVLSHSEEHAGLVQPAIQPLNGKPDPSPGPQKESLKTRFLRWLEEDRKPKLVDRREGRRMPLPHLIAFYWTGGSPQPYHLGDISTTGIYLLTQDRSSPGTIIRMTLQKADSDGEHPWDAISVYTRVVRWGADGVGLEFLPFRPAGRATHHSELDTLADEETLIAFLRQVKGQPRPFPQ